MTQRGIQTVATRLMEGAASSPPMTGPEAIELLTALAHLSYVMGMEQATRDYAVWKNGEQLVGVMQRPLSEVLHKQRDGRFIADANGLKVIYE